MNCRLLDFYRGSGVDHRGRKLETIWSLSHHELENSHDYIQWLFPNRTASPVNPHAPILDTDVCRIFREDSELQARLLESLDILLDFYGLYRTEEGVFRAPHFAERSDNWLSRGNHNHLRITRILLCLWSLGCEDEARHFFHCLSEIAAEYPDRISKTTEDYWAEAARQQWRQS